MALAGAALVVVTGGVVYFGHAFPLQGGSVVGTIAPAERYRSSQIQDQDVQLGNDAVPALMQTDAFQVDGQEPVVPPKLAMDPGFQALAQNPAALSAMAQNPQGVHRPGPGTPRPSPRWPRRRPRAKAFSSQGVSVMAPSNAKAMSALSAAVRTCLRPWPATPRPLPPSQEPAGRLPGDGGQPQGVRRLRRAARRPSPRPPRTPRPSPPWLPTPRAFQALAQDAKAMSAIRADSPGLLGHGVERQGVPDLCR